METKTNPTTRSAMERLALRWAAIPEGWFLQRLFHLMIVASVVGIALDAIGAWPQEGQLQYQKPEAPEPVYVERPSPGDNLRPYQPDMIPKSDPERLPLPVIPDGTPIVGPQFDRMRFTYKQTNDDVPYIAAVGDIATGTSEELRRVYDVNKPHASYIVILSDGGLIHEAIAMGEFIREKQLQTIVPKESFCFSACPLMLAGGVKRVVHEDAWIGLHQITLVDISGTNARDAFEDGQAAVSEIMRYLEIMGVQPMVWRYAIQTSYEEMFMLSKKDLLETNLATLVTDDRFRLKKS